MSLSIPPLKCARVHCEVTRLLNEDPDPYWPNSYSYEQVVCTRHREFEATQHIHTSCAISVAQDLLVEGHPVSEHATYEYQHGRWVITYRTTRDELYYCGKPQCLLEIITNYGIASLRSIAELGMHDSESALKRMEMENISAPQLKEALEHQQRPVITSKKGCLPVLIAITATILFVGSRLIA